MSRKVKFVIPRGFLKAARGVFNEDHIEDAKAKLALNPSLGEMVQKTGGARKIWQRGIGGQSRLIYYFHIGDSEVFFLTCYPKNRKSDLTEGEKKELRETIKLIKQAKTGESDD